MAVRLGERVLCGEVFNTSHYTVHGWIQLRGRKHPIILQLTGNCDPDLAGRHIRFESRDADELDDEQLAADEDAFPFLATQQVGPTGTMTAARKVKVADCPPTELYLRAKLGEPLPTEWKRCLYLEWFSQNGRVVVEMADPIIEFVDADEDKPPPSAGRASANGSSPAGQSDRSAPRGEAVLPTFGDEVEDEDGEEDDDVPYDDDPELEDEDPYGLFPQDLLEQFDAEASEVDQALEGGEEKPRVIYEMELMDELIESGDGVPLDEIFDGPLKLPRPEQLDDDEAESALKTLLAQLALFGIALDVCQHFTPRDAYRLLLEEICPQQTAYPELRNTQWVQHFMTSEFCPQCEAEFDREFDEQERQRKENPDGDPAGGADPGDDVPF